MAPGYRETYDKPIWAVYDCGKVLATVRADGEYEARIKLAPFRTKDKRRRIKFIGEW